MNSVLEIVVNGVDTDAIAAAMRAGIDAACRDGVVAITAGNYGGKLGPHHFHLAEDHERSGAVSGGLVAQLKERRCSQRADLSEVLAGLVDRPLGERVSAPSRSTWSAMAPPRLGDLFDARRPAGAAASASWATWSRRDRLGAGLIEGE